MTAYEYFKQQKEHIDRMQFYNEIKMEVETMLKSATLQIKEEILSQIKQEIDIQVNLLLDGKKIDNFDIGEIITDEVLRQLRTSL